MKIWKAIYLDPCDKCGRRWEKSFKVRKHARKFAEKMLQVELDTEFKEKFEGDLIKYLGYGFIYIQLNKHSNFQTLLAEIPSEKILDIWIDKKSISKYEDHASNIVIDWSYECFIEDEDKEKRLVLLNENGNLFRNKISAKVVDEKIDWDSYESFKY